MSRHDTSPPWAIHSRKRNRICGKDGVIVAEAWFPPARANRDAKQDAYAIGNANAEFIVRAVNSHDALVAALKEITEHYCALVNSGDAGSWDPEGEDEVKHARSALALVEQFQSDIRR